MLEDPQAVDDDSDVALIYNEITKKMIKFLVERNKNLPPTEILKLKQWRDANNYMKKQIEKALDEIRPFLQSDGGNIKLISFTETEVKVKLLGNCVNCTVNQMTLKNGVEMTIKKYVPQIEKVTSVE